MTNDLIDRYVYAVTKRLPSKIRQDVSDELNSLISDMLDERCGEIMPTEKDIRVVLTELGTPRELADKYNTEKNKCLIGSPYYSTYILVLKIVLICTGAGMLMTGIINMITESDVFVAKEIFNTIFMMISGMMAAFTFVTLLFTFFYHKNIKLDTLNDSIDNLPPVPKNSTKISKADCIIGIIISVVFAIVFLMIPSIVGVGYNNGKFISIFNADAIRSVWYLILIFALSGIIKETIRLIDGKYTLRVTISTIVANGLSLILSILWLIDDRIINPELTSQLADMIGNENPEGLQLVTGMLEHFHLIFLIIIIFALLFDMTVTVIKWVKNKND